MSLWNSYLPPLFALCLLLLLFCRYPGIMMPFTALLAALLFLQNEYQEPRYALLALLLTGVALGMLFFMVEKRCRAWRRRGVHYAEAAKSWHV